MSKFKHLYQLAEDTYAMANNGELTPQEAALIFDQLKKEFEEEEANQRKKSLLGIIKKITE